MFKQVEIGEFAAGGFLSNGRFSGEVERFFREVERFSAKVERFFREVGRFIVIL